MNFCTRTSSTPIDIYISVNLVSAGLAPIKIYTFILSTPLPGVNVVLSLIKKLLKASFLKVLYCVVLYQKQRARYIGYKNKPDDEIYWYKYHTIPYICTHVLFLLKRYIFTNLGMPAGRNKGELKRIIPLNKTKWNTAGGIPIFQLPREAKIGSKIRRDTFEKSGAKLQCSTEGRV